MSTGQLSAPNYQSDNDNDDESTVFANACIGLLAILLLVVALSIIRFIIWILIEIFVLNNPQRVKQEMHLFIKNFPCFSCCYQKLFPSSNNESHDNNDHSNNNDTNMNHGGSVPSSVTGDEHTRKKEMILDQLMPGIICSEHNLSMRNNCSIHKTSNRRLEKEENMNNNCNYSNSNINCHVDECTQREEDLQNDIESCISQNQHHSSSSSSSPAIENEDCIQYSDSVNISIRHVDTTHNGKESSCKNVDDDDDDDDLSSSAATTICSICLNNIQIGESIYITKNCYHVFHNKCIRQWVTSKPTSTMVSISSMLGNTNNANNIHVQHQTQQQDRHQHQQQSIIPNIDIATTNNNRSENIILKHDCPNCRTPLSLF